MKNECEQCGTCCERGGPALHREDITLVERGVLAIDDLVAVRQGEIVIMPESGKPEATEVELIKIQGKKGAWSCRFLHPSERTCSIYEDRPVSCRLLKCWDPEDVLAITGKKLLNRSDLVADDDPLLPLITLYDQQFTLPDMIEVKVQLASEEHRDHTVKELERMVRNDLLFRSLATERFAIPVSRELFYFGRPLFQLLLPLGLEVKETSDDIQLYYSEA